MSWFNTTKGLASLAKTALKEAQKQIDKALDIQEEESMKPEEPTISEQVVVSVNSVVDPDTIKKEPAAKPPLSNVAATSLTTATSPTMSANEYMASSNWGSFTGSFFENPKANEMVTIPPKATAASTSAIPPEQTIVSPLSIAAPTTLATKRQSVASNSDSVELLSPPSTSSTNEMSSPDAMGTTGSLPESIVIIGSNEESGCCDDEEDSLSYNTVMDDSLTDTAAAMPSSLMDISNESAAVYTTHAATGALLENSYSSTNTVKQLLMSMEDIANASSLTVADSDSTQSFEDIQMQSITSPQSFVKEEPTSEKFDIIKLNSPHNSNDEIETTTTSSDIEIISNPNGGDSSSTNSTTRTSPLKLKKLAASNQPAATSSGGNGSSKKGHYREPSEISIISEDSQSELDKLVHRISELSDQLEARELRLLQSERQVAALQERNNELQATMDTITKSNTVSNLDSSEEYTYTQRLSALEKKFQLSIRERDSLRLQIDTLKQELQSKIPKDELTESNTMIAELQLEGEKLSKEILQQSNIIKKLRAKEKSSDALLKKNKEQISIMTDEVERLKKTLNAKEAVERSQIEAVHKMSAEKRRLDEENAEYRSKLEDLQSKYKTLQINFDAVKTQLLVRTSEDAVVARKEKELTKAENQEMMLQLNELREKLRTSEQAVAKREQQLREENRELLRRLEAAELRAETSAHEISLTTIPLMRQLESLQNTLSQRTTNWNQEEKILLEKLDAAQSRLQSMVEVEDAFKEKTDLLQTRCMESEEKLSQTRMQEEKLKISMSQLQLDFSSKEFNLKRQISQMKIELNDFKEQLTTLQETNQRLEANLAYAKAEHKANLSSSTDELVHREQSVSVALTDLQQRAQSPATSFGRNSLEEAMGGSIDWHADDLDCISNSGRLAANVASLNYETTMSFMGHNTTHTLEHLQSLLKQRDGELRHQHWELSRLQAEREALGDEISHLTIELENAKDKLQTYQDLEANFSDLQHRYNALLQMYGEKVERTEELELDLVELKEAYKTQIDELLAQPGKPT